MLFFNKWGILNLYLNVNKSQEKTKTVFVVWVPICFCAKRTSVAVHTSLKHTSKARCCTSVPISFGNMEICRRLSDSEYIFGTSLWGFWWKLLTLGIASFIHGIKCLIHIFFFLLLSSARCNQCCQPQSDWWLTGQKVVKWPEALHVLRDLLHLRPECGESLPGRWEGVF